MESMQLRCTTPLLDYVCVCVPVLFFAGVSDIVLFALVFCRALWSSNFGPCGDNRVLSNGGRRKRLWESEGFSLTLSVLNVCERLF